MDPVELFVERPMELYYNHLKEQREPKYLLKSTMVMDGRNEPEIPYFGPQKGLFIDEYA